MNLLAPGIVSPSTEELLRRAGSLTGESGVCCEGIRGTIRAEPVKSRIAVFKKQRKAKRKPKELRVLSREIHFERFYRRAGFGVHFCMALKRSKNRILGGVCGGIANWLGWDPTIVRLAYVLISIFSAAFPGIIVYLILWVIMPSE